MDRECVSLLPRVCEVLADSGRALPDDTSLEKLLDWFTGLTETGGSLLESCPCLLEFISTVVYNTDSDPGVLSFALKLTGLMAAREDGFKMLQESSILSLVLNVQHWQEAGLWNDPCIRIGWIQGLRSMLQHPKALSLFIQSDLTQPLLGLQTDTSLFVASAANQMLAHMLLYFQPPVSTGCNDTSETSVEYSAVVAAISEYLKESLVPEVNTQHVQLLKLLAQLLAQARPPLRDTLLQTVADSLEQLVTKGCSQHALPLMDVILAAHSSGTDEPDKHISGLLSSLLNTNKPADLIHAAAAFLHRGHHDTVYMAWAVRTLLLPLDIITGQSLLGSDSAADELRHSTTEQMKSKTSCISMICVCLTNTPHITLMPADVLPCPPALIVTAVLSLLRICSGHTSSSSSSCGCTEVFRNIIASSKVQKCALEALTAFSSSPGAEEKMNEVFTLLLQYLENPESDPTVLHKSYQTLVKWTSVCTDFSSITDQLRQDLLRIVKKRVCDMRWEVRDSTVEFVGKAAAVLKSQKLAEDQLISTSYTTPLLKEALQDPESYVRASAISALAQTLTRSWQQGAELTQEQTEIVVQLLEILSQDTEGFARRAVVQYFIAWYFSSSAYSSPLSTTSTTSSCSLLMNSVRSVLSLGSADLDWEVKVHTLELARLLLDEAFSHQRGYRTSSDTHPVLHPYAVVSDQANTPRTHTGTHSEAVESDLAGALNSLVELGVMSVLLSGLVDYDRPVALKACRLLITVRDTVCPLSLGAFDATAAMATVARVSCKLPSWGWGQEILKVLGRSLSAVDKVESEQDESEGGDDVCVSVCEVLRSLGLDERLDVLSRSSDHVHNSPLSLLQDILTASAAHTHPDTQPGQEVIVDCY